MTILIEGKEAVLKKGASFEYISENHLFTGADSYTLSITFPLAGCPQNIAIFGYLNRKDCDITKIMLECELHDRDFHAFGAVSIVDITEEEVKTQFLQGRSVNNYYMDMDDIYINEMQLPSLYIDGHWGAEAYLRSYSQQKEDGKTNLTTGYYGFVCLPYVNNTSGNIQNPMRARVGTPGFSYTEANNYDDPPLIGMPFLIEVVRQVMLDARYSFDISVLENSWARDLVVCNALPRVWRLYGMENILPHWTMTEFLEQLGLFLGGEFIVDEKLRKVRFQFYNAAISSMGVVELENVIDTFKMEVSQDSSSSSSNKYYEQQNLKYADAGHQMWNFYSCDWVRRMYNRVSWSSVAVMREALNPYLTCAGAYTHNYYKVLHYVPSTDSYFVIRCYRTSEENGKVVHHMRIQQVNFAAPRVRDHSSENFVEINIVPACIDYTDYTRGDMLFIECGTYGDDAAEDTNEDQTNPVNAIVAGEKEGKDAFFDKLHVAFWEGAINKYYPLMPHPYVDLNEFTHDGRMIYNTSTMRLGTAKAPSVRNSVHTIDQKHKYTFSFLADRIPDVTSMFIIHGKKYLAEKITATFTEDGMSQLLKIVCYRVKN